MILSKVTGIWKRPLMPSIVAILACLLAGTRADAQEKSLVKAAPASVQNRSELSDGSLVVHVSKIENSATQIRQSGSFAMSVGGLQQGAPESIKATKGNTFLTVFFSAKAKSTDFVLDTAQILLVEPNGATIGPVSFSNLDCEYCMSVVGMTIGGPRSTSDTFGPYSVTFPVPQMGQDGLLFRVSGIDVVTIRELTHMLPPASTVRTKPIATAPPKVTISAGEAASLLLQKTAPVYPPIAKAARVSGTVVLRAVISKDGMIENVRVISGPAMLQQAALDAVRTWRYRPYLLSSRPVEVETTINVVFAVGG